MFPLRHAAARLLTSRSISLVPRPRTITSFAAISTRPAKLSAPIQWQRRWASQEAEAKKESEVPISELQPTPQEEVENAIHEDNAAAASENTSESKLDTPNSAAEIAQAEQPSADNIPASGKQSSAESVPDAGEQASVDSAVNTNSSQASVETLTQDIQERGGNFPRDTRDTRDRSAFRAPPEPKPTVYVGNLFFDVTENDLEKEFNRFGTIKTIRLIKDVRGLSKGFGYIEFESTEQAQAAVDALHQQTFEGRRLMVSFAHSNGQTPRAPREPRESGPQNPPTKTLFIGNMSFEMTDRDLNNLFRGIRNVIDVRVAIDRRTGQPRGFAHADFVDVKSATDAMKVLQGKENYGRALRVDYSYGASTSPRNTPR